jgi:hypothetical protein
MKIRDKKLKKDVDVFEPDCLKCVCYWPRPDPGSFTQGKGYTFRSNDWLCGTREFRGCPDEKETK